MSTGLRLIFAGTPDFAAIHLKALIEQGKHNIVGVYTQPDRPAGRGKKLQASPVKQLAEEAGITVYQPLNFKEAPAREELAALNADLMVVVAYGLILPQVILDSPRLGCINVHGSILPRWRGAAPIQRAIEQGDSETGITIMQMAAGLDTGDMLRISRCPISATTTSVSLHDELAALGSRDLLLSLDDIANGNIQPEKQDDSLSTYAKKIEKAEAEIDWALAAAEIDLKIRAFNPFPIAYTTLGDKRLKIYSAELVPEETKATQTPGTITSANSDGISVLCGQGALRLQLVQLPGAKAMPVADLLNSRADMFQAGTVLGANATASSQAK